jgi:hypothetical protein
MDARPATRTRRSLLTAAAAAGGALAAQAIARPAPVSAASVVLGAVNTAGTATTIRSNEAANTAKALIGVVLHAGAGGSTAGVQGQSNALHGNGVFGVAINGNSKGVWGRSANGRGVYGEATGTSGKNYGVHGESKSDLGIGVFGTGFNGIRGEGVTGVYGFGDTYGVYALGDTIGVAGGSSLNIGVQGSGPIEGVRGLSPTGTGVRGTGGTYGVRGQGDTYGVYGNGDLYAVRGVGGNYGAYVTGTSYGVFASSGSYAGWFNGKVHITGILENAGGSLVIDHPVDPANRTLAHSSVEAPERLNVYRGTVTLDVRGQATVRMPRYFHALNAEFGYQLTAIGVAAPDLHVGRRIERNSFAIAGGQPGQDVCWIVTGSRRDAWAKAHPLRVDRAKRRKDRGRYLNPEVHGMPRSTAINPPPRDARHLRRRALGQ